MERTGSQKALLVISIIDIVAGALGIIIAILAIMGGAFLTGTTVELAAETGTSLSDVAGAGAVVTGLGVGALISAGINILIGILGVRASNDNQKIMPVWVFAIIGLVAGIITLVMTFMNAPDGTTIASTIISLAIAALTFWIANNIKKQAGK